MKTENYNWKSNFKFNISSLTIMGLWPNGDKSYKFNLYAIYGFVAFMAFIFFHVLFQAINLFFIKNDLEAVVGSLYIMMIKVLSGFKAYYFVKNMELVKGLLKNLDHELFQPTSLYQKEMVKQSTHFLKILKMFYIGSCYGSNAFFGIYPLFDTSSEERRLPFLAWYPFDSKRSPYYEMTYVYQMVAVVFNTSVHINVDSLICVFNCYSGLQFDILADNLKNLKKTEIDVGQRLLRNIQHHKLILKYVKHNNIFFQVIVLLQFFISAVSIGITMFQLTLVSPSSNQFTSLICYISAIIVQIFFFCWFGNEVQFKSSLVPYAVFESDWIHFPQELKKICLFFTLELLQPVRLSAMNLFYLNLDTFVRILKTSWSYFAFLHQMGSRD